ncbi:MAG: DUF2058 domain-containing protein [Ectothiorhodospira sp.]
MANALQEQLLKSGLVDEKKLKQARQSGPRKGKKKKGKGNPEAAPAPSAADEARRREAERSRRLNEERRAAAERKARQAQIRQLIETHRESRAGADVAYHFQHGRVIRHVYVTPRQRDRLGSGHLAIVTLDESYEVVPRETADRIAERDPERVIVRNAPEPSGGNDEDDPYAGYEVPDDLMW